MDFFSEQDAARRRSGRLALFFIAAVIAIIAVVYVVLMIALVFADHHPPGTWWDPAIFAATAIGLAVVIGLGSLWRISSLKAGGPAVAEMVGGRLVSPTTTDAQERRLLNIVEEMALASGTPVPPVYVMDEDGINAFAAGYRLDNAVVGVTRGAMTRLSRDELQGVIAHEFSHILHGDMRLNIRLIGVLYGILMLSIIGSVMMRSVFYSSLGRRRSSGRGRDNGGAALIGIFALGLALYIIGSIGVLFGQLIKAAVSRQREFLADASAVQYTRNPDGIAGALKKLAGRGSRIENPQAGEASHFFFGAISSLNFSGLLATHPPLDERIRRIDPAYQGKPSSAGKASAAPASPQLSGFAAGAAAPAASISASRFMQSVGDPQAGHMAYGHALLAAIPVDLHQALHEPSSARAVVECLLLDDDPAIAKVQLAALERHGDPQVVAELHRLRPQVARLPAHSALEILELSLPALHTLSASQRRQFLAMVDALIQADQRVTPFEFSLRHILHRALNEDWQRAHAGRGDQSDARRVLQMVASVGHPEDASAAAAAFAAACQHLEMRAEAMPAAENDWPAMDRALIRLARHRPAAKRKLLGAVVTAAAADGVITADEADVVRAIALSLECPLPPLLAEVQPAPAA